MEIQDTLFNVKQKLDTSKKIRIYLCGITTYDQSHIGHARTIIVFDVLKRYLDHTTTVEIVQNFTDIDDKIINKAQAQGCTAKEISERYIKEYFRDFDKLNVKRAAIYPKATEHMDEIITFIKKLLDKKAAYITKNGVYFAVSEFPEYGKLSKKDTSELQSGARIKVDEAKRDPLDFAVWKFSDVEPVWSTPWGDGRPGWHIECSAMSLKYLGKEFEIHGGGRDLIFPHHENEIAQSKTTTNGLFAKIWMHVGMVTIDGEKMAKSLENIKSVNHVLDNWGPNVIRLFCLSGHYSKRIDYSEELLKENLIKWRQAEICFYELIHAQGDEDVMPDIQSIATSFDESLENDFNTHEALSAFFSLVKEANRITADEKLGEASAKIIKIEIKRMMEILGLNIPEITEKQKQEINDLIKQREEFRKNKEFEKADTIRDKLNSMNVESIDHKTRTTWVKKEYIKADNLK